MWLYYSLETKLGLTMRNNEKVSRKRGVVGTHEKETPPSKKQKSVSMSSTASTPLQDKPTTRFSQVQTLLTRYHDLAKKIKEKMAIDSKQLTKNARKRCKKMIRKWQEEQKKIFAQIANLGEPLSGSLNVEDFGMVHRHSQIFSKFAAINQVILLWRPINEEVAKRLSDEANLYKGKGLNTKGKSSEFGPIAGDIPHLAALSKLASTNPSRINEFQEKNNHALEESEQVYRKIRETINSDNRDSINDLFLITKVNKKIDGNILYYVSDEKGHIVWNKKENIPFFLMKSQKQWLQYSSATKTFNTHFTLKKNWRVNEVEVMAYRQFEVDTHNQASEKTYLITADYDALVYAPRKVFPFHNNQEIYTTYSKVLFQAMSEIATNKEAKIDWLALAVEPILKYEEKLKEEHREAILNSQQPNMGVVNEMQRAITAYFKKDTGGGTNHGPEVNNPYPEKFPIGNYLVHLPTGMSMLHNEQEICDFINQKRAEGFPLDVNPKWGWDVEQQPPHRLFIPAHRFDWDSVHTEIARQHARFLSLKNQFDDACKKYDVANSEANQKLLVDFSDQLINDDQTPAPQLEKIQKPHELMPREHMILLVDLATEMLESEMQYIAEVDIMQTKVAIEKLRLEPDIIYSHEDFTSENMVETEYEMQLREKVEKEILRLEYERRQEKIKEQGKKLLEQKNDYQDTYLKLSIIEEAEEIEESETDRQKATNETSDNLSQHEQTIIPTTSLTNRSNLVNQSLFQPSQKTKPITTLFQKQDSPLKLNARR